MCLAEVIPVLEKVVHVPTLMCPGSPSPCPSESGQSPELWDGVPDCTDVEIPSRMRWVVAVIALRALQRMGGPSSGCLSKPEMSEEKVEGQGRDQCSIFLDLL